MLHRVLTAGVVMGALSVLGVEDGKLAMTAENWQVGRNASFVEEGKDGGACMKVASRATILSKDAFPIDPTKTYRLSGSFKSVGEQEGKIYFGFAPLDADKQAISSVHVICVPGSETELAAACEAEDTVIKVKDGSKWRKINHARVAFEVDDSGEYSDLPNRKLSSAGVAKVEQMDDHWEITLAKPCGVAYPAGTKVRQHHAGSAYMYSAASNATVPREWETYSGEASGIVKAGVPMKQFWAGTAHARVIILANFMGKQDNVLLIDNITVVEE